MKKKLLISFSGGETSGFMAQWLLKNKSNEYDMICVFANTGCEDEETLKFIEKCDKLFGLNVIWVECITNPIHRKGVMAKVVNFKTASRNGEPFAAMIAKHGIPNNNFPHCTRELKRYTIRSYAKSIGYKKYYTAIGIRHDEIDRISESMNKDMLLYPLIKDCPMSKLMINHYWSKMPFRLDLKGYQGNCKWCWKKSLRKLLTIAKENPEAFDFPIKMEKEYGNYVPDSRKHKFKPPIKFFRGNLSAKEILELSKQPFEKALDDSVAPKYLQQELFGYNLGLSNGCSETCEAF